MAKEEFYPEEHSPKEGEPHKEVKQLISEGALSVFREENQIKVKPASEESPEPRKKKTRHLFHPGEQEYYLYTCHKFREENWILIGVSTFIASFTLLLYAFLPQLPVQNISLDVAFFFIGLVEFSLLASIMLGILANALFGRFLSLSTQDTCLGERKNLIVFLSKAYARKQAAKILWAGGMLSLLAFLFFYLANFNLLLSLCILMVISGLGYWIHAYIRMLEKTGILRLPRRPLPILEEDVSNVYPGASAEEVKSEDEAQLLLAGAFSILKSSTAKVRRNAVKTLAKVATPEAIHALIKSLEDSVPEVRAQAVASLGRIGEKNLVEVIICLLDDEAPEVRVAAAEALGNMQARNAVDPLIRSLEDGWPDVRGAAAEALGNIGKKKSLKPLLSRIKDEDWFVRHKVVIALGKIKAELSVEAIEKIMQARLDENEYVSSAARHVLKKLVEDMSQEDPLYEEMNEILNKESTVPLPERKEEQTQEHKESASTEKAGAISKESSENAHSSVDDSPATPKNESAQSHVAEAEKNKDDKSDQKPEGEEEKTPPVEEKG